MMINSAWRLVVLYNVIQLTWTRPKTINIFDGEGDILQLRNDSNRAGGGTMRNAILKGSRLKWIIKDSGGNYVIPYVITGRYDRIEKKAIEEAMRRLEENTCIRFRKRTTERDFIDIQNEQGEGCYTSVGRIGGRSVVMLEANEMDTCMEPQIVQHELMHVIGLWHEHMRADRDKYIKVHYNNIPPSYWSQFEKVTSYEATDYGIPYDYKSVMHYGKTAFAKRGRISMETLNRRYQNVIGKAKDASPNDYRKICKIYGCDTCMGGKSGDTSDKKESEEDEITERPILPPPKPGCIDAMGRFCWAMVNAGMMDCGYMGRVHCCASCAALERRRKGGWIDPFGWFNSFNFHRFRF